MKKILILVFLSVLFVGCANPTIYSRVVKNADGSFTKYTVTKKEESKLSNREVVKMSIVAIDKIESSKLSHP